VRVVVYTYESQMELRVPHVLVHAVVEHADVCVCAQPDSNPAWVCVCVCVSVCVARMMMGVWMLFAAQECVRVCVYVCACA